MKKPRIQLLALITCVFAAFIMGFFAGRNVNRTPVQIRSLPTATEAAETATSPTAAPAEPDGTNIEAAPTEPGIININTATAEQLQTLPGIGEVIAQRIIDYREENGAFQSIGELTNVSGIGEKRLEAIWDLVTIGG